MEEPLAQSKKDLEDQLAILVNAKLTCYTYLKRQYSAREARATIDKFTYPEIGIMYRDKKFIHCQYYVSADWTGGIFASPTLAGSRSGQETFKFDF